MPKLFLTGGGTAGHVTPNLALMEAAADKGWLVEYVGSADGIENAMVSGIPFHAIASGKLRRYFSWQNFVDPFRIVFGILQALLLCVRRRPDLVFSKGGFVAFPLVVAAWLLRIPVISHESDVTPGLANRLSYPFCRKICVTFAETQSYLPSQKTLLTGTPVRSSLREGDSSKGYQFAELEQDKPILLVFGGSLGAAVINDQVRSVLADLLQTFYVVHVTGEGNVVDDDRLGYVQREFIGSEFGDVLAAASIVICRAGANTLYELFLMAKPHLLIPLTRAASRGDQIDNATTFSGKGYSLVLREEDLEDDKFLEAVTTLHTNAESYRQKMSEFPQLESVNLIVREIEAILL